MNVSRNSWSTLAVLLGMIALVSAFPAAAQDEILFDDCEDRLFRYSEIAGYSCRGTTDVGTFEDECVCFKRHTVDAEVLGADFTQYLLNDPGCQNTGEYNGLLDENVCSCQPAGAHLRRSSRYLCTPTLQFNAESDPPGHAAFGDANWGSVRALGTFILHGNGLNDFQAPPVASAFACKRSASCQV